MSRIFTMRLSGAALALTLLSASSISQAAPPAKDHPLVGRYEGAELVFSEIKAYDEADLIQGRTAWPQAGVYEGPISSAPDRTKEAKNDKMKPNVVHVEGAVSTYQYKLPEGRSLLEVQRSYENSLKSKGFNVVFTCKVVRVSDDGSCFDISPGARLESALDKFRRALAATNWPGVKTPGWESISNMYFHFKEAGRYMLAKREAAEGVTYVSIALSDKSTDRKEGVPVLESDKLIDESNAFIRVVEGKPMDAGKITFVDASAMQKSLDATGRVNLYGIYFDTDKDTIKPESKPTLDEIGKLMNANAQLHLQVVGHTDSTGGDAHNKDLSNRRAASVIRSLAQTGIDATRFASRGAGASEPVESNDSEQGRAKNRRVELVRM